MPPPFQQQGQGYNSHHAGYFSMTTPGGGSQTLSTMDEEEDCVMSASSGMYDNSGAYQGMPQYLTEDPGQGPPYSALYPDEEYVAQHNPGVNFEPNNVPVHSWMAREDAWNSAGPSRQNSLQVNQQLLEELPGDLFANQNGSQWMQDLNHECRGYIPAGDGNQDNSFDPAVLSFPENLNAMDDLSELNQALWDGGDGQSYYPPDIDVPPPGTEGASQPMASRPQLDSPSAQRPLFECQWENCRQRFTSKTAFKKHKARHEKPEICPWPNCGQGFAARIDLERHSDCKHYHDLDGNPTVRQPCPQAGCTKTFPQTRNDNRKQHLIRIHGVADDLAEQLINNSATGSNHTRRHRAANIAARRRDIMHYSNNPFLPGASAGGADLSGYPHQHSSAQSVEVSASCIQSQLLNIQPSMDTETYHAGSFQQAPYLRKPIDPLLASRLNAQIRTTPALENRNWPASSAPSSQPTATAFSSQEMDDVQDSSSFSTLPSPPKKQNRQQFCLRPLDQEGSPLKIIEGVLGSSTANKLKSFSHTSPVVTASTKPSLRSFVSAPDGNHSPMEGTAYSPEQSVDGSTAAQVYHALGAKYDFVEKDITSFTIRASVVSTPAGGRNTHPPNCKGCLQWQDSPCQLRKHITRKAKPYFCPEDHCGHDSGSKNDQMRHHNSQHINLEKFICDVVTKGQTCGKQFNLSGSLQSHLTGQHSLRLGDAKEQVKRMRVVNENFPKKFRCGICECWLELDGSPEVRRELMFTHIEDHLLARNGERFGTAEDWRPQAHGDPQMVEKALYTTKQAGSTSRNSLKSEPPLGNAPSERGSARPQPARASYSADNKRHSSMSPSLRPHMAKKLKSDTELGRKTRDKDAGAARSRRGKATVATITYTCCECLRFGAAATGLCECGHEYNICCEQQVVRQPDDEFWPGRGGRKEVGGQRGVSDGRGT